MISKKKSRNRLRKALKKTLNKGITGLVKAMPKWSKRSLNFV